MRARRYFHLVLLAISAFHAVAQSTYAASYLWTGTDGDLGNAANWGGTLPGTADEAQFINQGTNPTMGNLAVRYIGFYGPTSSGFNTTAFTLGGGAYTISSGGNIDLDDANANQVISPTSLEMLGSAQILTSAGSTNTLTISPTTTFTMHAGSINASTSPDIISPGGGFFVADTGTTTLNAAGSNITITSPTSILNAARTVSLAGTSTIALNGGMAGGAGNLIDKMGTGGLVILGSSGAWAGQIQLGPTNSSINTDFGNIQMNAVDSLGDPGGPLTGYTDLGPSHSGALIVNNTSASPWSAGEYFFVRGRDSTANPVIVNAAGNNTFTGTLQSDTAAGSGANVTFRSDAGTMTYAGTIDQQWTTPLTLNLGGASNGTVSGTLTQTASTWSVAKNDGGTWTISGTQGYTGTTTVNGGTLLMNATHTGGAAYSVLSGGTLGGNGTINTAGNAGVSVAAGGFLAPGAATGTLHMNLGSGTLDISGAVAASATHSLLFTLATTSTSSEVQLTNAATALSIGTGVLNFDDFLFTNIAGFGAGTYTLFDSSTAILGTLGSSLTGTIGGLSATLSLADSSHDIVLTVTSGTLLGDVNGDHVVNGLDIAVVASHWLLTGATLGQGDANGDGTVNGLDIALIASHWLNTSGPGAGSGEGGTGAAAVPEPSTCLLAACAALGLMFCGRRKHANAGAK